MKITIAWLKENNACTKGIKWFGLKNRDAKEVIESLIDDHPKNSVALQRANWAISKILDRKDKIRYAVFAAEQVIDIFEKEYPNEKRPRKAIEAAKKVIKTDTKKNRDAAASAAANVVDAYTCACAAGAYTAAARAYTCAYAAHTCAYAAYTCTCAARAYNCTCANVKVRIKILQYGITLIN